MTTHLPLTRTEKLTGATDTRTVPIDCSDILKPRLLQSGNRPGFNLPDDNSNSFLSSGDFSQDERFRSEALCSPHDRLLAQ